MQLRPYQIESIEGLRAGIRAGHRAQLLVAPTGAGKSVCAAHLLDEAHRKQSRVAFVCDRIVLVNQFCDEYLNPMDIPHGVMQAGHWRNRPYERIQVCSAQTIEKRGFPGTDLVIIDEAHCMRKAVSDFVKNTSARVIGLTATPFAKGMGALYSNMVNVTTTNKLIDEGFLVPLKAYAAKAADMTGAKIVAGEWAESEIEQRGNEIIGDIVAEWQDKTRQHFGGPAKTIVFSATVAHGEELCRQFQGAGFNFVQISYKSGSDEVRKEIIEEFRKPDSAIHGLVSCEVLTKGFDVKDVLCGISARPYRKSFSSHIQQLGRVMRPAPGKSFALWLDHSGNYLRFHRDTQELFEAGVQQLDDGDHDARVRKEPEQREKDDIRCSCGYVLARFMKQCPACGKERVRLSLVETLPGEMVAIDADAHLPAYLRDRGSAWNALCSYARSYRSSETDPDKARRFVAAKWKDWYGSFPRQRYDASEPYPVGPEQAAIWNRIKHDNIKWAKSQRRKAA